MTVVYLDSLFLLNLGLDALLLSAAQRLSRNQCSWKRTALASALGATYACAILICPWDWMGHPLTRLAAAVAMAWLCAGTRGRPGTLLLLFLLLACSLAGGVLVVTGMGLGRMSTSSGFPVTQGDGKLLMLCAAGEYAFAGLLAHGTKHQMHRTVMVLLRCEGRSVLLRSLVDSGNLLRDPLSGTPVVVVSAEAVSGLLPKHCRLQASAFTCPEGAFAFLAENWSPSRVQLIPFHSVGNQKGLLLAIRLDSLEVDGKKYSNRLAALTPEPFSEGHQAIIGLEGGCL